MPVTPTSKIQLVKNPPLPAECVCCKRSATGQDYFIDFGVSLDWYGAILFCPECAAQMVDALDYAPVAEINVMKEKIERLEKELAESMDEAGRLQNALDSILIVRPDLHRDSSGNVDLDDSDNEHSELGIEEADSGFTEPATERGSKNVSQPKFFRSKF